MKQIFIIAIMIASVLTLSIINVQGIAFAYRHHSSDFQDDSTSSSSTSDTGSNQLLCWATGGILLLGGVPAPAVLAAGAEAHNIGICP
jgi:hypothetical protein